MIRPRLTSVLCAVGLAVSACTTATGGVPVVSAHDQAVLRASLINPACAKVTVPLVDVPPTADREPRLRVPEPPGWSRYTGLDSKVVRLILRADNLVTQGFTTNLTVIVEDVTDKVGSTQEALSAERDSLNALGPTDMVETPGTLCGFPSLTLNYKVSVGQIAVHPATSRFTAVPDGQSIYVVALTIQTFDDANPQYVTDRDTIMDDVQITLPPKG